MIDIESRARLFGRGGVIRRLLGVLRSSKLVTNAGVYVLGNVLQKSVAFLLIPVYTRYLTPDDYGITGLGIALGSVLAIALGFGIFGSVARHYYDYRDSPVHLKQFITSSFLFVLVAAGVITLVLNYVGPVVWPMVTSGQVPFSPFIRVVLLSSYAELLIQIPLSLYRTQQRAMAFVIAQISTFTLTLSATILFVVVWRMGAYGQLLGYLVGYSVMAVVLTALLFKEWWSLPLNWGYLGTSLAYGLPLVPHSLAGWAMASVDRLLLEPRVSLGELGLYNLGYQIGMAMSVLVYSVNQAWSPYYYDLMKRGREPGQRVRQVTDLYVVLLGGICLLGALFSQEIIAILAPARYLAAARYVPLILFSYLLNGYYFFASMPLFYHKKTQLIPIVTGASAALNIVLNLWWIPTWGALGSAWATLVSYVLALVIAYLLARRWDVTSYSLGRFGALNAIVFFGVVYATYGRPLGSAIDWSLKFGLLALFACISWLWLIRPNLKPKHFG